MIIDSPIISGSLAASGSLNQFGNVTITGSLTVTGNINGTASYATTASYLSGYVSPFPYTGSAIISGSLEVTGSANIPNITGSLLGTASFANTATSSSFATTASFSLNVPVTSSYANNATSASFATTASYLTGYISPFPYTGSAIISGSLVVTGSVGVSNLSGSGVRYLVTDASGSITAQSASAALKATQEFTSTAGQTTFTVTNGYATGYVDVYINGSKLSTSEFTDTSGTNIVLATGSFSGDIVEVVKYTPAAGVTNNVLRQLTTLTGSAGQTVFSASYTPGLLDIFYNGSRLSTSDYTANNGTYFTLATASAADDILDVLVYSYQVGAFNGIGGQGVTNQLAFFNTTSSITGSNSFTVSGNTLVGTASYALNADTLDGAHLSILATTGSNTFTSAQYISNTSTPIGFTDTASLYTDGGLRATKTSYFSSSVYIGGDLIIFGSQSVNYITSSQLNIADNIITVNTSSPAVRFGGIAVQDSGSLATGLTGSLLWDSQNNHWIYTNPSGSSYSGGMLISGPRNTGSMGDEQGTTLNAIMKGMGGDHITSSGIFESGTSASFYNNVLAVSSSGLLSINATPNSVDEYHYLKAKGSYGAGFSIYEYSGVQYINASSSMFLRYNNAGSTTGSTSGVFAIASGSSEVLRITAAGNVNIGRTDDFYKFSISSGFPKTETNAKGLMFIGSNEANASNPFGLVITITGASTLANRKVQLGTTDFGLANGGLLSLQGLLNITGSFVGIGTTTPLTALDVKQTATGTATENSAFRDSSSNGNALQIWNGNNEARLRAIYYGTPSDQNITFYTITSAGSEAERLRITSAGNLSIGNSSPQNLYWANVRGAVIGNYSSISSNSSSGWTSLANNAAQTIGSSESTGWSYQNADAAARFALTNGGFVFQVSGTGAAGNAISWTDAVTIMNAANSHKVGIRATNPRTTLQVTPYSNAETPVLGTATGAVTFTSANTNYGIQFNSTSDGSYFIQSQRFDSSATAYPLGLNPVGSYVWLGKGWGASNHRINLEVAQGNNILVVSGYSGASNDSVIIKAASGANPNATTTVMEVTTNSATGRSISAGGTINASGTDYAEYIEKEVEDTIAKGDIVGINSNAKLTNIFADAISFVVKSTNPSYVGGDAWGNVEAMGGKRPERTIDQTEEEFAPILAEFEARLEIERVKVDRIAFSGQVPCNVTGANVGDYIIPIELENGKIGGQAITNPTFEQYQISVGKVWKIMDDGRAWIAVKIG